MNNRDLEWWRDMECQLKEVTEVFENPNAKQVDRDLARIKFKDYEEKMEAKKQTLLRVEKRVSGEQDAEFQSVEWAKVEDYERGRLQTKLTDRDLVALAEGSMLQLKFCPSSNFMGPNPNGELCFYPKLRQAVQNQLTSSNQNKKASAHFVMGWLLKMDSVSRPVNRSKGLEHFQEAVRLRPQDFLLRKAIALEYHTAGKHSLSLETLNVAKNLAAVDSFDRFEVERNRSMVLARLGRVDEAKTSCIRALLDAERLKDKDEFKKRMTPLEKARLIQLEYLMVKLWFLCNDTNKKVLGHRWHGAEQKYHALPPDLRRQLKWDTRFQVEKLIATTVPELLTHCECHFCHEYTGDPKRCGGCKAVVYCSQECCVAHWKAGHKKECQTSKVNRKKEKKEKKAWKKEIVALQNSPPLDATLDPRELWNKAKMLSRKKETARDAVFYFCMALFLDFEEISLLGMGRARAAIQAWDNCDHPLSLALDMVVGPFEDALTKREKANEYELESHDDDNAIETNNSVATIDQLDHLEFGMSMCNNFIAQLTRYKMDDKCLHGSDVRIDDCFDELLTLTESVRTQGRFGGYRWLTLQFDLGYRNLDVGAADEAQHWFQTFLDNLQILEQKSNGNLSKHWTKMRIKALKEMSFVETVKKGQENGVRANLYGTNK